MAAALGVASLLLFWSLVPKVPARSADRLDVLGVIGLAVGLVTLLLGITKGHGWGWTSTTTLTMFGTSLVVFFLFGLWQLRVSSPIVDLRTTVRRPVLATNLASIGVGFALFAMSLSAPQILELPTETGYGLGQSLLHTGLWMAPGGLAMMLTAPMAAKIAGHRGPRFTFVIGCVVIAGSYVAGRWLIDSAPRMLVFNVAVSVGVGVGVGIAFFSMPALINAAVPMSETAAANGINSLARSLGTSLSSAVMAAILATMTMPFAGHDVPTLEALRVALLVAAGAAGFAALLALTHSGAGGCPRSRSRRDVRPGPRPVAGRQHVRDVPPHRRCGHDHAGAVGR